MTYEVNNEKLDVKDRPGYSIVYSGQLVVNDYHLNGRVYLGEQVVCSVMAINENLAAAKKTLMTKAKTRIDESLAASQQTTPETTGDNPAWATVVTTQKEPRGKQPRKVRAELLRGPGEIIMTKSFFTSDPETLGLLRQGSQALAAFGSTLDSNTETGATMKISVMNLAREADRGNMTLTMSAYRDLMKKTPGIGKVLNVIAPMVEPIERALTLSQSRPLEK